MPIDILRGPAGAGKSQFLDENLEPGEIVIDLTLIHVMLNRLERGPDGVYPVRRSNDPTLHLARRVKRFLVETAEEMGIDGLVTTSDSSPEEIEKLRGWGATGDVDTIDPGEDVARARLARGGRLHPDCARALGRWYGS